MSGWERLAEGGQLYNQRKFHPYIKMKEAAPCRSGLTLSYHPEKLVVNLFKVGVDDALILLGLSGALLSLLLLGVFVYFLR